MQKQSENIDHLWNIKFLLDPQNYRLPFLGFLQFKRTLYLDARFLHTPSGTVGLILNWPLNIDLDLNIAEQKFGICFFGYTGVFRKAK